MNNTSILKMVVMIIGLLLVVSVLMIGWLVLNDKTVPDIFQIIAVSGITGLLGLLAPSKDATNPNA